jgi:hypothetical protein
MKHGSSSCTVRVVSALLQVCGVKPIHPVGTRVQLPQHKLAAAVQLRICCSNSAAAPAGESHQVASAVHLRMC